MILRKPSDLLAEMHGNAEQVLPDEDMQKPRHELVEPAQLLARDFLDLDDLLKKGATLPSDWAHSENPLVTPNEAAETLVRILRHSRGILSTEQAATLSNAADVLRLVAQKLGVQKP